MSNVSRKTKHSSKLDEFVGNLVTKGWTVRKPQKSKDKSAIMIKICPPMTKLDIECVLFGADENHYYVIGMGGDYVNIIPARFDRTEENISEILETIIKRTEDGQHEEIPEEISDFLRKINQQ